ncbi:polyadenylate-binding protein-interacting protein 5-like isoform X3 [Durio zibethinus]|uniref:Polyadenylate-binding protein-interacting protein 5-like isoform X3 n=1 Tax=Durio zibethinus TaxID=66656 RepID=A0A6P5ZRW3_DURZI|nr:polyadenylate-binding protein-interacting protein 5-like isoform X3 [Durio zibethinus]XP_022755282.1 polyadenylate-binding protein-interacting protein 5-like isoform X3 [Durio zibethinus]
MIICVYVMITNPKYSSSTKPMKPGVSSLNPYAASYIPLAKRESNNDVISKDIKPGDETAWFEPSLHFAHNPQYSSASLDTLTHGTEKHQVAEASALKSHSAHGSLMHNPNEMTDKHIMDEEFDMDLEFLRMTFPGLSNESLLDVYLANNGDLETSVDMLNQLEPWEDEFLSSSLAVLSHTSPNVLL